MPSHAVAISRAVGVDPWNTTGSARGAPVACRGAQPHRSPSVTRAFGRRAPRAPRRRPTGRPYATSSTTFAAAATSTLRTHGPVRRGRARLAESPRRSRPLVVASQSAAESIRAYHVEQLPANVVVERDGLLVEAPAVDRAGCYVPEGAVSRSTVVARRHAGEGRGSPRSSCVFRRVRWTAFPTSLWPQLRWPASTR